MIQALTLTDAEHAQIPALWPDEPGAEPGSAFLAWQRSALAAEIEARAARQAQQEVQAGVVDAVALVREAFPTVFGEGSG